MSDNNNNKKLRKRSSTEDTKEGPIPFLVYEPNTRKFTLTSQGEDVIKSFKTDFGVVSVAGMYRTGKSYLINRMLLNRQKGFSVGPTINPCTKGLWIWSKPIYGDDGKGRRIPILLIDTEGFGALDTDSNHDIRIFTLAILLSSYFLYNSVGGIDESALQNLNFVINLSKFIKVKANELDNDPEELANLFPSFLWVLRDFSLQLIDDNGENITPKQYLEKVLEGTKNSSDPKNKIRKLIKTYFKDRDCFTMVRPLTNENMLQSLEDLPPEKLRPEFLEQIINLRKKVLGRARIKTLNGQALNGEMYLNLIKGLITAMNSGSVPNIESTWLSMCKIESYKAFEEAELIYESYLKENLENGDDNLEEIHKEAKEQALKHFKKKALGDVASDYLKELKNKIKEKYNYYVKVQEEESKGKIIRVLNKWYSIIEQRIQNNEFKSIEEISKDFITLEQKLNETFPNFGGRDVLFNEFKTKVFTFAGTFFTKKAESERKYLQEQTEQKINKLTNDLEMAKKKFNKEEEKKEIIIQQNKTEILELKEELNNTKENLAVCQKEKEIATENFNNQITRLKEDFDRKMKESEYKSTDNEEKQKEAERKAITIKAEYDKEKALLSQKIEHLNKQIDDYIKREKEMRQENASQLKEQTIAYKDKMDKYEKNIKLLTNENEELKDKLVDLEGGVESIQLELQNEKNRNNDIKKKFSDDSKNYEKKLKEMKENFEKEKSTIENVHTTRIKEKETELNECKSKLLDTQMKQKQNEDQMRAKISEYEKEIALLKQENEFLKKQNDELNKKLSEQKTYYENIISNLENKAFQVDHEEFQKKINEIKNYYEEEKKNILKKSSEEKESMLEKIEKLQENLNKEQMNFKNIKDEYANYQTDSKSNINKLSKENSDRKNENEKIISNLNKTIEQLNAKMKSLINDNEKKLEEKEAEHQNQIIELNKNSEDTLTQLKNLFENEKQRLEEKLKDEKNKSNKKISGLIEDYENKLKEIENELKDENENLKYELNELNQAHENYVTNAEHEFQLMNQKIINTEKLLGEAKANLENEIKKNKLNLDNLNSIFNKERKEFQIKLDNISNDLNSKEKELTSVISKKEQLEKIIQEKEAFFNKVQEEVSKEKDDLQGKYEELKKKYNILNDSHMTKNLEYARDTALLNQQIDYLNKKNIELQQGGERDRERYEQRLFSLRAEVEKDLNEKFDRIKQDKADLENKLIIKKREMKELEQSFTKQEQLNSKEKNDLNEKLILLQKKFDDINDTFTKEKQANEKQINLLTKANEMYKNSINSNEQNLKNKIYELETNLLEKTAQYEKDQILWEGKFRFIEQQRDTIKKEAQEANKRFENTLDSIQKKSNSEKENIENSAKISITNLEQKYQKQVKDLQDNHNKLYSELLSHNKDLEKDLKSLRLENELSKNKNLIPSEIAKKLEEINNERDQLLKKEKQLKEDNEKKMNELIYNFDKEREQYQKRINEIEKNLREAEGKKGSLVLELEKEKAKWNIEKDGLVGKYTELNDKMVRLEKKNELLLRENEKLRNEINLLRRAGATTTGKYTLMLREGGSSINQGLKNLNLKVLGDLNTTSSAINNINNMNEISGMENINTSNINMGNRMGVGVGNDENDIEKEKKHNREGILNSINYRFKDRDVKDNNNRKDSNRRDNIKKNYNEQKYKEKNYRVDDNEDDYRNEEGDDDDNDYQ